MIRLTTFETDFLVPAKVPSSRYHKFKSKPGTSPTMSISSRMTEENNSDAVLLL